MQILHCKSSLETFHECSFDIIACNSIRRPIDGPLSKRLQEPNIFRLDAPTKALAMKSPSLIMIGKSRRAIESLSFSSGSYFMGKFLLKSMLFAELSDWRSELWHGHANNCATACFHSVQFRSMEKPCSWQSYNKQFLKKKNHPKATQPMQ